MTATFEDVKTDLLDFEGGYANSSIDEGGETKYGISKQQYPDLNIKSLTFDQACQILKRDYWDRYRINEIENQQIANKIFFAIMNAPYEAISKVVQRAVNYVLPNTLVVDGVMGSKTIDIINRLYEPAFLDALRLGLANYYLKVVLSKKSQTPNLPSWLRRALR